MNGNEKNNEARGASFYGERETPLRGREPPLYRSRGSHGRHRRRAALRRLRWISVAALAILGGIGYFVVQHQRRPSLPPAGAPAPAAPAEAARFDAARVRTLMEEARGTRAVLAEADARATRGLHAEAARRLALRLAEAPNHTGLRRALAEQLWAAGDIEEAAPHVAELLATMPDDARVRRLTTLLLLERGEDVLAYDVARDLAEEFPADLDARRLAARAALAADETVAAVAHLRFILGQRENDIDARRLLALALLRRSEAGRAIPMLQALIREGEASGPDYFNLAAAFAQRGQAEDVLATLSAAGAALGWDAVHGFMAAPEFEPFRTDARFRALERQMAQTLRGPPVALMPRLREPDRPVGLLPEPLFQVRPDDLRPR